jgi:class 3 adenylate cyclase/tetratricopeptide (TPR) repeat protein
MNVCAACGAENPDAARFCMNCGTAFRRASRQPTQRKIVTVVFCDLVDSTGLAEKSDPEAVRTVLVRYFECMRGIVEQHGGTVQKFIGDAVVAIFGVPVAHEDDALRGLRAAQAMRDALPGLEIDGRIGVNTGEVITSSDDTLVTGDAVNVAARLQQTAAPGEILIGAETRTLVGEAADVEELEPLELKGKTETVSAFRLVSVGEAPDRSHHGAFVGRSRELRLLFDCWERVLANGSCELLTIVGEPGIGKSRLVVEFERTSDVQVVHGRCLAYGEGIAYFPVISVVRELGGVDEALLASSPGAAAPLHVLLGESEGTTSPEEIAWAFRKLLEVREPLVVVLDDLQWAEETVLDLIENLARLSSGAALLLICVARPELVERRPNWSPAIVLEPLPPADVETLLPSTLAPALRGRIAHAAGGNPLFVTEMVAMTAGAGDDVVVPATLKALIAARLDHLDVLERAVLERGAIEGEVFHSAAVEALSDHEPGLTASFAKLVRRDLIRPEHGELEGEKGFRFRHLLIRDVAYNAIPKRTRADLHDRHARWLEGRGKGLDAFVGYHLEQAYRYRVDLHDDGPVAFVIARRASESLERAATTALDRSDFASAAGLLERASGLPPISDVRRARLMTDLGATLIAKGDFGDAERALDGAAVLAGICDEVDIEARVLVERQFLEQHRASVGATAHIRDLVDRVVPIFERSLDAHALCRVWYLAAYSEWTLGHVSAAVSAWERAAGFARAIGADHERAVMLSWLASCTLAGPMPAIDAVRRCEEIALEVRGHPAAEAEVLRPLAGLRAYGGQFDLARELFARRRAMLEDIGYGLDYIATLTEGVVEMLAGNFEAAEKLHRQGYEALEQLGENAIRSTAAAQLARSVLAQGRHHEAEKWRRKAEQLAEPNDLLTQILCSGVRAGVLVAEGRLKLAEAAAREGVELAATTDLINTTADACVVLSSVLAAAGRSADASSAADEAIGLYEQKGNLVAARAVRQDLDSLAPR